MTKNLGMFFGLPCWGVGAVLLALCAFTPVSRASLYDITFTDNTANNLSGFGTLDITGSTANSGTFTVTGGTLAGTYTLNATAGFDGHFSWGTTVNVGSNPFLTGQGLLFTSGFDEINLWASGANSYHLDGYISFNDTTYSGLTGGSGPATLNPVPEPINYALAAFGLIFVCGSAGRFYIGRRRSATAS